MRLFIPVLAAAFAFTAMKTPWWTRVSTPSSDTTTCCTSWCRVA